MMIKRVDFPDEKSIPAATDSDGNMRIIIEPLKSAYDKRLIDRGDEFSLDTILQSRNPWEATKFIKNNLDSAPLLEGEEWAYDIPLKRGEVFCIGRNYAEHARELNNPIPAEPVLFMKPRSSLVASGENICLPKDSEHVELEGELALIAGSSLFGEVEPGKALEAIFGVTLLNDVTDRGKQKQLKKEGKPWVRAKGLKTFAPCGPAILVVDNTDIIDKLTFTTSLNGETCQQGKVEDWIWTAGELLASIAETIGINPGDIIATGTPAGVKKIKAGDKITIESPMIGTLENDVAGN
ncbi:MAG: fumarylacetoacetate hydrolase family protein [Candidatus Electryonea clarkiae]|nr:fumarylacetoacetate hydrolase family protein [Candidatus Electryonea clarkiae]MDP8286788.1 fumarylacetoacetate hydrolase family protein [Candidatus Electryonea clarkiae]